MKGYTKHLFLPRILLSTSLLFAVSCGSLFAQETDPEKQRAAEDRKTDEATRFAAGLLQWGLNDYARLVMDDFAKSGGQGITSTKLKSFDVQSSILTGKFAEADKTLKQIDQAQFDNWTAILDGADAYFNQGMWDKTQFWYDEFFQRFPSPPSMKDQFFKDSAYKYAQMLERYIKDSGKAYKVYTHLLNARPTKDEVLQIKIEMGQLALKVATKQPQGGTRDQWTSIAQKCAEDVQWGGNGTIWFGKSVVILAHIQMLKGDRKKAMETIDEHMESLKSIHAQLLEMNDPEILKLTPMAECRYLLGKIYYEEGMALMAAGKKKDGVKLLGESVNHLFNVFVKYPTTIWAPQAGKLAEDLFDYFQKNGIPFTRPPTFSLSEVMNIQFQEARMLMLGGQYEDAIDKFIEILAIFPEAEKSVMSMGDLSICYFNNKEPDCGMAVAGHLIERFRKNPKMSERAGTTILNIASDRKENKDMATAGKLYDAIIESYPTHPQRPMVLLYRADVLREAGNYAGAMDIYKGLKKGDQGYELAISSMAYIYRQLTNHTEEAKLLKELVDVCKPSHDKARAQYRLAAALMDMGKGAYAAAYYKKAIEMLKDPANAPTPEDAGKNKDLLGFALYNMAGCCAQVTEPPEKVDEFRKLAIKLFDEFATDYPKLGVAPDALLRLAILQTMVGDTAGATRSFDRLKLGWPDSEQAKGMYYYKIKSEVELKYIPQAKQSVNKMLNNADQYNAQQFMQVAKLMGDNGEADLSVKCFEQAMALATDPVKDRAIIETSLHQLGLFYAKNRRYAEAVESFKKLFEKYPNTGLTVDAAFSMGACYAEIAVGERDANTRIDLFNESVRAINKVAQLLRNPNFKKGEEAGALSGRVSIESGRIYEMKGRAEEMYSNPDKAISARNDAIAAYFRLFMMTDPEKPGIKPWMEEAFPKLVALEKTYGKKDDIPDYCRNYLKVFPDGKYVADAQKWLAEMGADASVPVSTDEGAGDASGETNAPSPEPVAGGVAATAPAGNEVAAAPETPATANQAETVPTAVAVPEPAMPASSQPGEAK